MNKKDNPNRKIETHGGSYIDGSVKTGGGDFVGHDQNKVTVNGGISGGTLLVGNNNQVNPSLVDLTRLVSEIHILLPQVRLDEDTRQVVEGDFKLVETQLAKPEPKKALILSKLKGIAEVLGTASAAGQAVQKLVPMLQQAVVWAQQVLR